MRAGNLRADRMVDGLVFSKFALLLQELSDKNRSTDVFED
jgi:hypothetical protein